MSKTIALIGSKNNKSVISYMEEAISKFLNIVCF